MKKPKVWILRSGRPDLFLEIDIASISDDDEDEGAALLTLANQEAKTAVQVSFDDALLSGVKTYLEKKGTLPIETNGVPTTADEATALLVVLHQLLAYNPPEVITAWGANVELLTRFEQKLAQMFWPNSPQAHGHDNPTEPATKREDVN